MKKRVIVILSVIGVLLLSSSVITYLFNPSIKNIFMKNTTTTKVLNSSNDEKNPTDENLDLPDEEDNKMNDEELSVTDENKDTEEPTTTTTFNNNNKTTKKTSSTTTKPTTKKTTTTVKTSSNKPSVSTDKFDSDINSVKLNPIKTRNVELDKKVEDIINKVTNSKMTNNQKLYAVFRYIIDHSEYGNGIILENDLNSLINQYHYNKLDGNIVYEAKKILDTGYGVCDDYAALFVVMARRLGFDAYWVGGSVKKASGGTTGHAWANILANGTYYVFDAQIADKRPEQEKYYYGKTDKEITIYSYDNRESYIKSFNKFKEVAPLKLDVTLSGAVSDTKSVSSYRSNIIKNVEYNAHVGEKIQLNIKTSGASKYTYNVRVNLNNGSTTSLYTKSQDTNNNLNLNYTFADIGSQAIYISVWSGDTGVIAEYYFTVNVTTED